MQKGTRFVPDASSRTNFRSFLGFDTAEHSLTFTARKSLLRKVSKFTWSADSSSIFTPEKSVLSFGVKNPICSGAASDLLSSAAVSPLMRFTADGLVGLDCRESEDCFLAKQEIQHIDMSNAVFICKGRWNITTHDDFFEEVIRQPQRI